MKELLTDWLSRMGLGDSEGVFATTTILIVAVVVVSWLVNVIAKQIIVRALRKGAQRTRNEWDDALVEQRVFLRLSHIAPAVVIYYAAPRIFTEWPTVTTLVRHGAELYMLFAALAVVFAFTNAVDSIYKSYAISRRVSISGYLQVVRLMVAISAGVLALSIVLGKSPWVFLSGIGAMTAVLMLIFKDAILGFVAGIQIAANDMVRPGDWIAMPKYGADGDVIELNLTTVKVSNWDKTITTIPTYALISDSFKNWRGMSESGGRRIKRSILIDVNSIRFCTQEMTERYGRIQKLHDYIESKQAELAEYNSKHNVDDSVLVNGRRMTNVGTFRTYLVEYLRDHPKIHQDMTLLVRQLQPTPQGLPIEIYVFSNDQDWVNYEAIQSDIFDHIFASLPEFDLRVFQYPTSLHALAAEQTGS